MTFFIGIDAGDFSCDDLDFEEDDGHALATPPPVVDFSDEFSDEMSSEAAWPECKTVGLL